MCEALAFGLVDALDAILFACTVLAVGLGFLGAAVFGWVRDFAEWVAEWRAVRRFGASRG